MGEHDEQVALFQFLKTIESKHPVIQYIYAIPNGGLRKRGVAGKLKAEGVKSGVLDIHVPRAGWSGLDGCDWQGLWVEMKYGKNKLSENQKWFKAGMEELGHKVVVCYNWQDAANEIMEYLGLDIKLT
jgi:hypothetical protein